MSVSLGYWLVSGGCTQQPPNGQQFAVQSSSCEPIDSAGNDFELKLNAASADGRQLTCTRRVVANPEQDGSLEITTEIHADGQLVMSIVTRTGPAGVETQVDYGPLVPGLESADIDVQGGMVNGTINGRALIATSVDQAGMTSPGFQDGAPAPDTGAAADLETAVVELLNAAATSTDKCQSQSTDTLKALSLQSLTRRTADTGHDSSPESSAACIGCWAGCSTGAAVCIGGVSAGCAASLLFYAVCEAIGVASCAAAYLICVGGCNATGAPCCPVACGEVACCGSDETCLNAEIGLCCSPGKTPCVGEECCSSTQVCISTGPNAGTCCEPENLCGNTCCEPTDTCIEDASLCCPAGNAPCQNKCCPAGETCLGNGNCCRPDLACGSACCDELDAACIPSQSLCCGFSTVACNNQCCAVGEGCVNGTCCPQERICSGQCCPEGQGCDPVTKQCKPCPNPDEKYCQESDSCCPTDKVCSPVPGVCCNTGEIYCFGACREFSECIK
jgi:hypothetical protein